MINNFSASLRDLLGASYTDAVCAGRSALTGESIGALREMAGDRTDLLLAAGAAAIGDLWWKASSKSRGGRVDNNE